MAYRINQQPLKGTELELCYRCDVVCRSQAEAHVRALLLQSLNNTRLHLSSLSEDLEESTDRVKVEAEIVTQEPSEGFLEQIISRLSLEPGVIAVRWRVIEQEFG